jgi:phosphatidylserine/phosphatidylglycerophosphate/cardiolipin synthase-like enzyme
MTGITTLLAKFFVNNADITMPGEVVPHTSTGNRVTALIDGNNYFGALRKEVDVLKKPGGSKKFFYFANWWMCLRNYEGGEITAGRSLSAWTSKLPFLTAFKLDDGLSQGYADFIDEIDEMSANDTDVRALLWVNPLMVSYKEAAEASEYYLVNATNLLSADLLRSQTNMDKKVCLNLLGWPIGSMHMKMVVCGDDTGARAYVSGIDLASNRADDQRHLNGAYRGWHDAGAMVEGPAVSGIYNYLKQLWDEQISHSIEKFRLGALMVESHIEGTEPVPASPFPSPAAGNMHVQVLRTAPQMHFAFGGTEVIPVNCFKRLVTGFRRDPWKSAPDGIFEFSVALQKAIMHAEKYIYVEDAGFQGQPIMDWLRTSLANKPALKLIMLHRADPADNPNLPANQVAVDTATAINMHLGSAGVNMNSQVAYYERTDKVVIHSKIWIIDDVFAIIGAANCSRRSLYSDGELSVSVIDEDNTANNFAVDLRKKLWGEHCGLHTDTGRAVLNDIDQALKIWDVSWGGTGAAPAQLLPVYQYKRIPFEVGMAPDQWPVLDTSLDPLTYDRIDGDSRKEY